MFVAVLQPFSTLAPPELERYCTGLVGAGEALSAALVRGRYSEAEATTAFASLILHGVAGWSVSARP